MKKVTRLKGVSPEEELVAYHKVVSWFFAYPREEFTLNELCSQVGMSKTTGKMVVMRLIAQMFLKFNVIGRLWRISANQSHSYFTTRKIAENLRLVYESGVLEEVNERYPQALAVVLFGSYRKGDDVRESDLDLAIEVLGNEELQIIELGIITKLGYRENVKVNVHVFTRNKIDINLFTNVANGILLRGLLEARP
ncbi:nucleotidyltransferase domain-containing protein [Candidatus Woesearchaeota archaeon]|nr:nucleotidyltransferase domain-containing protein [Candidatus Woesearchaeota archaeon]